MSDGSALKAINLLPGNQMSEPKKTSSKRSKDIRKSIRQHETAKAGRKLLTMIIQAGESDEIAIREFLNECLVPILAKRFMSEKQNQSST